MHDKVKISAAVGLLVSAVLFLNEVFGWGFKIKADELAALLTTVLMVATAFFTRESHPPTRRAGQSRMGVAGYGLVEVLLTVFLVLIILWFLTRAFG